MSARAKYGSRESMKLQSRLAAKAANDAICSGGVGASFFSIRRLGYDSKQEKQGEGVCSRQVEKEGKREMEKEGTDAQVKGEATMTR